MSNNQSEIIDIGGLFRQYLKKWYYFAISVVVCGVLGYLFSLTVLPKYEVKASIQLNDNQTFSSMISGGLSGVADILGGNASGEDEVAVITSHTILTETARKLGLDRMHYKRLRPTVYQLLYKNYPVDIIPGDDINIDTLRTEILAKIEMKKSGAVELTMEARGDEIYSSKNLDLPAEIKTDYGTFSVVTTDSYTEGASFKNKIRINSFGQAGENLREQVNVGLAAKNSQIINFQMYTENVGFGVDVINTMIESYIHRADEQRIRDNNAMSAFLAERLDLIMASLSQTETALTGMKEGQSITGLTAEGKFLYERIASAESALTEKQVEYEMSRLALQMVRASAEDNSLIPLQGENPAVAQLIASYNNAVMRRMSVEESAKPDNAALQRINEQITSLRNNIIETLETQVKRSQEVMKEYERIYSGVRDEIGAMPQAEQDFHSLYRQRTIQEQIYVFLLQKQEETAMLLNNMDAKATVIDPAYALNEDMSMSTVVIMVIAIFFGLMIPPVIFFVQRKVRFRKPKNAKKETED